MCKMYMGYVVIFLAHTLQALFLLSCAHAADCLSLHSINVAIRAFWHHLKLLLHTSYCSFGNMKEWLRARHLFDFFTEVNVKPYEWARDPKNPDIYKKGVRFKCLLNEEPIHPSLCFNEKGPTTKKNGDPVQRLPYRNDLLQLATAWSCFNYRDR